MADDNDGEVAVVTGAARGLGLAIAERLGTEGWHVFLTDVDDGVETVAAQLNDNGLSVSALRADVTSEEDLESVGDAAARHGRLTCWINSAGVLSRGPLTELQVDRWDHILAVNTRGAFLGTRAAARRMPGPGAIVNLSSVAARVAFVGASDYCASKGAIESLTRCSAVELGARGIRVNAVAPGRIPTAINADSFDRPGEVDRTIERTPLGRLGTPNDIAGAVAFLCGKDAAFITGVVLPVDGGWPA